MEYIHNAVVTEKIIRGRPAVAVIKATVTRIVSRRMCQRTPREEAAIRGILYYIGKECPSCGDTVRRTSDMRCVECERIRNAANYAKKRQLAIQIPPSRSNLYQS